MSKQEEKAKLAIANIKQIMEGKAVSVLGLTFDDVHAISTNKEGQTTVKFLRGTHFVDVTVPKEPKEE